MYSDPIAANNVKAQSRQQQQVTHCHPEFKPALSRVERVQDLSPPQQRTHHPRPPRSLSDVNPDENRGRLRSGRALARPTTRGANGRELTCVARPQQASPLRLNHHKPTSQKKSYTTIATWNLWKISHPLGRTLHRCRHRPR